MKLLIDLFDRLRPHFKAPGKLALLKPVFEASENFFFSCGKATSVAPHIRDPLDVKRFMSMVIVALAPCLAAAVYFFGLRVLAVIVVSYAAGGVVEVLFAAVRKEEINEGFLVTGLLFPLILPPGLPLWMVAVGVAFGVLVGKEVFGGTGRNPFNPALVGRCFLAIAYPLEMSNTWIAPGGGLTGRLAQYVGASASDAVSSATPLTSASIITGKIWGLVYAAGPMLIVSYLTVVVFLLFDLVTGRLFSSGGSTAVVNPEVLLTLPVLLVAFTAFACMVGLQASIKSRKTMGAVFSSMGIVIAVFVLTGSCALMMQSASSGETLTAAFMPLTPDRKSTRLNSSHTDISRMPSSA